jgi:Mn2+/Fe2+ NRAMP family transporter
MNVLQKLGPGLLYAGAAIGVSHLVQSTTAGAKFGLTLIWAVVIANIIKYPIFEFGVRYAKVKQENLLVGYRSLGKWAIILFALITLGTMFAIQAAVTIVTAGLFEEVFSLSWSNAIWSSIILLLSAIVLGVGKYRLLDKLIKVIIITLSLTTVITLVVALFKSPSFEWGHFEFSNTLHIGFLIALIGWMPAPFDVTVWQSIWVVEKNKLEGGKLSLKDGLFDFKVGFWGAAILAVIFLLLGALILFGSGEEISPKSAVFARQMIHIFTENLGTWSYPIVALAALTTMFSTTITCLDAFPRVLSEISKEFRSNEDQSSSRYYWIWMAVVAIGAVLVIAFLTTSMRQMVNVATIISFVTAPVIAIMNYKLIFNKRFPKEHQPGPFLKYLSWIGITFFIVFSLYYLILLMQ